MNKQKEREVEQVKDKDLIRVVKFFNAETESRSQDPWARFRNGFIKTPCTTDNILACRTRTNILLMAMSNDDINDLVNMVKIGKYGKRCNNPRLSSDECIEYLRKWNPGSIVNDICSYLDTLPKDNRQRTLFRKVNEIRIKTLRNKSNIIETR